MQGNSTIPVLFSNQSTEIETDYKHSFLANLLGFDSKRALIVPLWMTQS